MYTRAELKANAKEILRRTYGMSWVACLCCAIIGGGVSLGINRFGMFNNSGGNGSVSLETDEELLAFLNQITPEWLLAIFGISLIILLLSYVYTFFVGLPVSVGLNRFFMVSREENPNLRDLFFSFTSGSYLNIVKATFLVQLYTALWGLLLIIPGIIKSFEYCFVPYIIAENPAMETRRAFEISREMTQGRKWDIFVLNLSFIGWYFLGICACGVGTLFVLPYHEATLAELYTASRTRALQEHIVQPSELPGFSPYQTFYN